MIQVYQKNDLFIIEDSVIDVIYPNLSKEEAIEILKRKGREPDRVDYAIKDFIPEKIFKGVVLEDNRVLKKALELACQKIDEMQPNKPAFICGDYFMEKYNIESRKKTYDADYFIQQAKESEKDGN